MIKEPRWFKYLIFNNNGDVTGIDPKAPDDVKKEYEEYKEKQKQGYKL